MFPAINGRQAERTTHIRALSIIHAIVCVLCMTRGAHAVDCNTNGVADSVDIAASSSADCNADATPDECQLAFGMSDCNSNNTLDMCETLPRAPDGTIDLSEAIQGRCYRDCNTNGYPDAIDIAREYSVDCDTNGIPDECPLLVGNHDCNTNGTIDACDADCDLDGTPNACDSDCNTNGTPDGCDQPDCNSNGAPDACDLSLATADCNTNDLVDKCEGRDCNTNGRPDECDIGPSTGDCNTNGTPDACDRAIYGIVNCHSMSGTDCDSVYHGFQSDCNTNGTNDRCERVTADCDTDGIIDACDVPMDCNSNGTFDACEYGQDCNSNGRPDACDLATGTADGCNTNGTLDVCEPYECGPESICWCVGNTIGSPGWERTDPLTHTDYSILSTGFPLNFTLWDEPGPADLPPVSTDIVSSTTPLVSRESAHFNGPSPHATRPTLSNMIDLVTGVPLIQSTDFELPFGGAVFRHVRTYSEAASYLFWTTDDNHRTLSAAGGFWDWNGTKWMMSESPFLLIDAQYPQTDVGSDGRRCYFIVDAHHAIPFELKGSEGNWAYVAPPWFDAIMSHNGTLDENGNWATGGGGAHLRPTEFYVYLHRKSIKYTIKAYYEDHFLADANSGQSWPIHDRLPDYVPGTSDENSFRLYIPNGIPYYGLTTSIADRYGHIVDIEYCSQTRSPADGQEPPWATPHFQNCNEKGQIRRVRLIAPDANSGSPEVVWTLAYTYRGFLPERNTKTRPADLYPEQRAAHMLHTIHAYRGNLEVPAEGLTIPAAAFSAARTLEEVDAVDHDFVNSHPDWVLESRYAYTEEHFIDRTMYPADSSICVD